MEKKFANGFLTADWSSVDQDIVVLFSDLFIYFFLIFLICCALRHVKASRFFYFFF